MPPDFLQYRDPNSDLTVSIAPSVLRLFDDSRQQLWQRERGGVLFAESIGRTDFPGGSYSQLIQSIKEKLLVLDDEVKAYPGHGPATTIGWERRYNPYLQ